MTGFSRPGVLALTALALAGCASTTVPTVGNYPVYQLTEVTTQEAAWAAARQQDQPVLILGAGVYGLSRECIPARYYAGAVGDRAFGSALDARNLGSAVGGRELGSAVAGRELGAAESGRQIGSAADARNLGSAADSRALGGDEAGRNIGGADAGRLMGGDSRGRAFGQGEEGRAFGAVASPLTCNLSSDRSTILIYGATTKGYLYSPRHEGSLEGVYFL